MPRRILTVLRTESLPNDGTALVLLAVSIEVVVDDAPFSWAGTSLRFLESYAGGIAIGAVVALLLKWVRRRLHDPLLHSVLSVATPFFAFLPAELAHVSGVLAVVTCGLVSSRYGPRVISPHARVQATAFWEVTSHLLNSALFVLVGVQMPAAVRALASTDLLQAVAMATAVSAAVIGSRFLWFYTVPYAVRFVDRRPVQRERRIGAAQRLPLAWAGMRGAISLAAALTVPAATADGRPLAHRDAVVFTTACCWSDDTKTVSFSRLAGARRRACSVHAHSADVPRHRQPVPTPLTADRRPRPPRKAAQAQRKLKSRSSGGFRWIPCDRLCEVST